MAKMQHTPTTFAEAHEIWMSARSVSNGVRLGNNTTLVKTGSAYAIRLHYTDVVTFTVGGQTILYTGGHVTRTTLDRMNQFTPWNIRLNMRKGEVVVSDVDGTEITRFSSEYTL